MAADPRALVGAPFRLHGRDPATGLDCVGVIAAAFGVEGVPRGYSVRTADAAGLAAMLGRFGFGPAAGAMPGDVLMTSPGPGQLHLVVMTADGFVHADAGLGRVVETPGLPDNLIGVFRWRH